MYCLKVSILAPCAGGKVTGIPKVRPLQSEFLPEHSTGDTFDLGSELRHGCGRRVFNQEVNMVRFYVELQQLEAALLGDTDTDGVNPCQVLALQNSLAVLGGEDQVANQP